MNTVKTKEKGRILKVKEGYNPNSSSIGSGILPFLVAAAGAGIFTIVLANTLEAAKTIIKKNKDHLTPPDKTNATDS